MSLKIWTAKVAPNGLSETIQTVKQKLQTKLEYLLVEWWNRPSGFYSYEQGLEELKTLPGDAISGSVFGEELELRWRNVDGTYWLVAIWDPQVGDSTEDQLPEIWHQVSAEEKGWDGKPPMEEWLLLWGSQYAGEREWRELRIPRPLYYPVDPEVGEGENVRLKIATYSNNIGQSVFKRRTQLAAFTKNDDDERNEGDYDAA